MVSSTGDPFTVPPNSGDVYRCPSVSVDGYTPILVARYSIGSPTGLSVTGVNMECSTPALVIVNNTTSQITISNWWTHVLCVRSNLM